MHSLVTNIDRLHRKFLALGIQNCKLVTKRQYNTYSENLFLTRYNSFCRLIAAIAIAALLCNSNIVSDVWSYVLGVRCILPNNYLVWEATRPISDCTYCSNIENITVLQNITLEKFRPYAYLSRPILIKGAASDWPATSYFTVDYFRQLYAQYTDEDVCQFLPFKSKFDTLADVFASSSNSERWYVGWGNCHPDILTLMRKHYPARPPFLPPDSELPATDYVFMGYGVGVESEGATMHIDFIGRLMWQAQLRGVKRWRLLPINECELSCNEKGIEFIAEPGDLVLVDTRLWYHATLIQPAGEFSISIQSEYG